MLPCPRCTFPMDVFTHQGEELDHCRRCGGTFLDPGEAAVVFGGSAEPEAWRDAWHVEDLGRSKLPCPKDREILTAHRVRFEKQDVEVDTCPRCGGLWLDRDEGATLFNVVRAAQDKAKAREMGLEKPGVGSYLFQLFTGFPVEVWNPVRRRPVVVFTLVGLLAAIFVVQLAITPWLAEHQGVLMMVPAEIRHGQHLWTIVTSGFLHGGFAHLLGNLYFLYIFGDNVEDVLGRTRFLTVYAVSLLTGSLLHFAFNADSAIPMLGASGAISGIMASYVLLFPKTKLWVMIVLFRVRIPVWAYLGFWVLFQVAMAYTHAQGTAWFAHLGGFAAGMVATYIYKSGLADAPGTAHAV